MEKRPKAAEGDIVEVRASSGEVLGYGFYSATSQIVCRMFDWEREPGEFETVAYWHRKLDNALQLRRAAIDGAHTDAYRLIHAEGDFLPGLIADVYGSVVVLQVLVKGIENRLELIRPALQELGFAHIYAKTKTSSKVIEDISFAGWLHGQQEPPVVITENGLKFKVDFIEGQKTGFFLDQRDNRKLLQTFSEDKNVLNTFSYTGGFSIYALAGGAKKVVSVDVSEDAVRMCNENAALNGFAGRHEGIAADCFEYLKDLEPGAFDIIVLDPPAFAKHVRSVPNATRGYKQINLQAFRKIKPGGIVFTFSCSQNISAELFQKVVFGAAADARRNVRIIHHLSQPADHPVNIYHPEGEYLKGLALWVE